MNSPQSHIGASTIFYNVVDNPSLSISDFTVKWFRKDILWLNQTEFAKEYWISLATLKKWEKWTSPIYNDTTRRILAEWTIFTYNWFCIFPPLKKPESKKPIINQEELDETPTLIKDTQPKIQQKPTVATDAFQKVVDRLLSYKPSEHIPSWQWKNISKYPRTLEWWEQFRKDLEAWKI
jgi:hypothetical protein